MNLVCYFQILFEKVKNDESRVMFSQSMYTDVMKFTDQFKNS